MIEKLVEDRPISRQEELASLLTASGFQVTQASVSRDLEELGIAKFNGAYSRKSVPPQMQFGLRSLNTAGDNLIVGKCDSGLASAVTVRIDAAGISQIVGTIAGDDTVFIAVANSDDQTTTIAAIKHLFSTND